MIRERYLAHVPLGTRNTLSGRRRLLELGNRLDFRLIEHAHFTAIAAGAPADALTEDTAGILIFGQIFRRGEQRPAPQLSQMEAREIVATRGTAAIDKFWGCYVAIVASPNGPTDIIRAPFGNLPCYFSSCEDGLFIASDVDLLIRSCGSKPGVAWEALAAQLIAGEIRRPETCLDGIFELGPGDRLSVSKTVSRATLWDPWRYTARERRIDDREQAASMLSDEVCDAVAARTHGAIGTVLLLSGGLDSSIVAASLARAGRECTALTMVTRAVGGDERSHAQSVADHCGIPLRAIIRDTAMVDVTRSAAAALPYPVERSFSQATMAAASEIATETGAQLIVHGGGGDNIFCALQSAAPLADLIAAGGLDRRALAVARDIAAIAQATTFAVARQALHRLLFRGPNYRWPPNLELLSPAAAADAAIALCHPWLAAPQNAQAGSAAHIALILGALSVVQGAGYGNSPPSAAVLLAQPVIETCLTIPSWLWFERGRNRAVARRAFEPLLPHATAWRTSKGAMDSFIVELFEANRATIRAMLLDGWLAKHGLIDRNAVARILDEPAPVRGQQYGRIMQFADTEAWLASWM